MLCSSASPRGLVASVNIVSRVSNLDGIVVDGLEMIQSDEEREGKSDLRRQWEVKAGLAYRKGAASDDAVCKANSSWHGYFVTHHRAKLRGDGDHALLGHLLY